MTPGVQGGRKKKHLQGDKHARRRWQPSHDTAARAAGPQATFVVNARFRGRPFAISSCVNFSSRIRNKRAVLVSSNPLKNDTFMCALWLEQASLSRNMPRLLLTANRLMNTYQCEPNLCKVCLFRKMKCLARIYVLCSKICCSTLSLHLSSPTSQNSEELQAQGAVFAFFSTWLNLRLSQCFSVCFLCFSFFCVHLCLLRNLGSSHFQANFV